MPPSAALPIEPRPEQFSHAGARWLAATRPAFLSVSLAGAVLGVAASLPAVSWGLVGWALLNTEILGQNAFDPYPYGRTNLFPNSWPEAS
jgi:1,4-dihydroxy-2-naphthoate octaprenyltransferase